MIRITDKDTIVVMFADSEKTTSASISLTRLKELVIDEALDIITKPECKSSSCAVNGFCECDPINEDMECAGIYLSDGKNDDVSTESSINHDGLLPTAICVDCEWKGKVTETNMDTYYDQFKDIDSSFPSCPKCSGTVRVD